MRLVAQLLGLGGTQAQAATGSFTGMQNPGANSAQHGQNAQNLGFGIAGMMSSKQWKENIGTISEALPKVLALRGVEYNWRETLPPELWGVEGERDLGLVAEEVDEVVPALTLRGEDGEVWGVKYPHVVGLLVEAMKEQQAQIEELKEKIGA